MTALSKKGQETRQTILNCAFDLFHERGIHATSIDDILKKSGAGKSQFYHYFKGKEDILHELLMGVQHMIENGATHMKPINSWEDFENWLNAGIEEQMQHNFTRACPIGQISCQLSADDELLRQDIKNVFESIKNYPKAFFTQLQEQGLLKSDADPNSMADMCIATMQGGCMLTKVHKHEAPVRNVSEHLLTYMKSFLK